jgi:hypothetical protein
LLAATNSSYYVFRSATGKLLRELPHGLADATLAIGAFARLSESSVQLATVVSDNPAGNNGCHVRLWRIVDDGVQELLTLRCSRSRSIHSLAFGEKGNVLLAGVDLGIVEIWDLAEMRRILRDTELDWIDVALR